MAKLKIFVSILFVSTTFSFSFQVPKRIIVEIVIIEFWLIQIRCVSLQWKDIYGWYVERLCCFFSLVPFILLLRTVQLTLIYRWAPMSVCERYHFYSNILWKQAIFCLLVTTSTYWTVIRGPHNRASYCGFVALMSMSVNCTALLLLSHISK